MDRLAQDLSLLGDSALTTLKSKFSIIPGSSIVLRYIASSYQHDPIRSFFELLLLLFAIRYFLASKYSYSKKNYVQLTDAEIDELVQDWQPEPLVKPLDRAEEWELESIPVVEGSNGSTVVVNGQADVINLSTYDVFGINNNQDVKANAVESIRKYGVGSCGPAGFYGNQDAHVKCEENLASFLGTEGCILYAQGLACVSSVIPCFMKRSDVIVADDRVNLGIQKGMLLSRATFYWYKHNDMEDLERTLARANRAYRRGPLPRRFIITEGVFESSGDSPDLKRIIELKKKYKYRLLLDESWSLGILGATGRGLVEEAGCDRSDVEITLGTLIGPFGSAGGFCAGRKAMVEHQRITSLSYTFSATMPPYLANMTSHVISMYESGGRLHESRQQLKQLSIEFATAVQKSCKKAQIVSRPGVPTVIVKFQANNTKERLQQVVDTCLSNGVLVSRHKRLPDHELFPVDPTIKVFISTALTSQQVKAAASVVAQAFNNCA